MTLMLRPQAFSTDFDRLFSSIFGDEGRAQRWTPAMDLAEEDQHFVLRADLPGLTEEDVSIELSDNVLRVSGERKAEEEHKGRGWYRVERSFGRFSRSLTLPEGIEEDQIEASFRNGVLEVRIPKPEERQPRRIAIHAGDGAAPKAVEGTATEK